MKKNAPRLSSLLYGSPWYCTASCLTALQVGFEKWAHGMNEGNFTATIEDEDEKPYEIVNEVAVLRLHGIMGKHLGPLEMMCGGCSIESFTESLYAAAVDPLVRSIVLDIHSPGGTVNGTTELAMAVSEINLVKPIYAFTDSMIASAAYYVASQTSGIFATPSSGVGGIGVVIVFEDNSRELKNAGREVMIFASGDYKMMGYPGTALTDKQRSYIQTQVASLFNEFAQAVKSNRGMVNDESMQGQMFLSKDALAAGLIDEVVFDISEVIELASIIGANNPTSQL